MAGYGRFSGIGQWRNSGKGRSPGRNYNAPALPYAAALHGDEEGPAKAQRSGPGRRGEPESRAMDMCGKACQGVATVMQGQAGKGKAKEWQREDWQCFDWHSSGNAWTCNDRQLF